MDSLHLAAQTGWQDYALIDSGDGEKLEQFGEFTLVRPDPQIVWRKTLAPSEWQKANAVFKRTHQDKGQWQIQGIMPDSWHMHWQDMTCVVKLSPFKHTGVFPEQSAHWSWIREKLALAQLANPAYKPHILNLFAYTGMASLVCAKAGARITHVDASRAAITWASQNQVASGLDEKSVRWILDDVVKFVSREAKRGVKYDGIIMDPPVYGHGPKGETWDFKRSLPELLELCEQILAPTPLFIVINAYAVSTSALTLGHVLRDMMSNKSGVVTQGELILTSATQSKTLSTGIWARWTS